MTASVPPITESEKRAALDAVLASPLFARSAQLRGLLSYICEQEWSGRADALTEYQIAVAVLGRRKDFDLTEDSSVRNRAYELRQRLEKFYSIEQPDAGVRIVIPRGGYVPSYTRASAPVPVEPPRLAPPLEPAPARPAFPWPFVAAVALASLLIGGAVGLCVSQPRPARVIREAWGPLADPSDQLLISVATNMHMLVRPHITPHSWRLPAPSRIVEVYGPARPLLPGEPLYMEPAQLSVPLAELAATATLSSTRMAFGGTYQILPESEAPAAALRGRNAFLIGTGTNSIAARAILKNLPFTIDYTPTDEFAVYDQRKPAGQNALYLSQPMGPAVPSTLYGLISVITAMDAFGKPKRTVVVSGSGSAAVQAAVEYFCSPPRMAELRSRFSAAGISGFPPTYQVVIRARTVGPRLISYEYAAHVVVQKSL